MMGVCKMSKIVLASSSPRRKEILSKFNIDISIIKSNIVEKTHEKNEPQNIAMSLAFQKAFNVSQKVKQNSVVLGADTIVYNDKILGKPENEKHAYELISSLNGKTHYVITGFSIIKAGTNNKIIDYVSTKVKFQKLSDERIKKYIDTKEYEDKAGGYAIQGFGSLLVDSIEGSYFNVVGLPIVKIDYYLRNYFDIDIL